MFNRLLPLVAALIALSPLLLFTSHLSSLENLVTFFGRFHPVVLHLPIGILFLAAIKETLHLVSFGRIQFTTRFIVFVGAFAAVAAMTLGILLMQGESMQGDLVISHLRWGIATAVTSIFVLVFRLWPKFERTRWARVAYYNSLYLTCGIMIWASHQGASITHGETYLTAYAPWLNHDAVSAEDTALIEALSKPEEALDMYAHLIVPILDSKCYECHKSTSFKGNLQMDTYEGLLAGGDTGPAFVPFDLENSLMIERMHLPLADEERMPPANKPQLTDEETRLIEWWVKSGAPVEQRVAALNPSEEMTASIQAVQTGLLETLNSKQHQDEPADEHISEEKLVELRKQYASTVAGLQMTFPGMIAYLNEESAEVSVRAFHDQWSDEDMAALEPIAPIIVELAIPRNTLTTDSFQFLQHLTALRELDLRYGELGDKFVSQLPELPLERLNLFDTGITDSSLQHLKIYSDLERLALGGNDISEAAIGQLRESLPNCEVTGNLSLVAVPE